MLCFPILSETFTFKLLTELVIDNVNYKPKIGKSINGSDKKFIYDSIFEKNIITPIINLDREKSEKSISNGYLYFRYNDTKHEHLNFIREKALQLYEKYPEHKCYVLGPKFLKDDAIIKVKIPLDFYKRTALGGIIDYEKISTRGNCVFVSSACLQDIIKCNEFVLMLDFLFDHENKIGYLVANTILASGPNITKITEIGI